MEKLLELVAWILLNCIMPAILLLGFLGNFSTFLVYSRAFFRRTSCGFYLKVLTVTDTVSVIAYVFSYVIHGIGVDPRPHSVLACKMIWFLFFAPCAWSAWIEAFICFDRMAHIIAPSKFSFLNKKEIPRLVVTFIILFNTVLYSPLLHYYDVIDLGSLNESSMPMANDSYQTASCDCTSELYAEALSWYDLLNSTLAPCFIMVVCTIAMLCKIKESRQSIQIRSNSKASTYTATSRLSVISSARHESSRKRREQRDRQFAITSTALCVLFFALNVGIVVFNLLCQYSLVADKDFNLLNGLTLNLFIADYSTKFYLYLIVNRHFLFEFKGLLFDRYNERSVSVGFSSKSVQSTAK